MYCGHNVHRLEARFATEKVSTTLPWLDRKTQVQCAYSSRNPQQLDAAEAHGQLRRAVPVLEGNW